jgi:hypothetical protein
MIEYQQEINGEYREAHITLQQAWDRENRTGLYTCWPEYVNANEDEKKNMEYLMELDDLTPEDESTETALYETIRKRVMEQGWYKLDGKITRRAASAILS